MRTKVTLLFILAIFTAQITAGQNVQTEVISFQINPVKANISDLIEYERRNPVKVEVPDLSKKIPKTGYPNELPLPEGAKIIPFIGGSNTNSPDPIVPTPDVPSPSPSLTFESLIDNISSIPPDVQGVVGPNHVFTVLNSQYRYHNRTTGATLSTVTPTTFWSPTGKTGIFDPNMVYDPFNNRWIFAICARTNPESFLLVAVSQTNDPTGIWNYYTIDVDANNVNWFDYPSLGFNKDWIVVGGNMFSNAANAFSGSQIYAFDKATMYAGGTINSTNSTLFSSTTIGGTHTPAYTYDNTLNKIYLLQNWNGNSGGAGYWRLYEITGTTHPLTFTSLGFPTGSPWSNTGVLASQPTVAASQYIDAGDTRMQNVVYRNGKLWGTHTIFLPSTSPTRASCQTWEINPTSLVVNQSIRVDDNDGVAPQEHFYYPSIAVNANNDLLMGFAHSSVNHFAGGMYALRKGTDASGTIRENVRFVNGLATYFKTYSGTRNRWGDYTATVVDPVNDTDFWTIQEFASTNNGTYDRWSTQWAKVVPPATNAITTNAPSSLTLCAGKNYNLTFTAAGVYNTGNIFTAQLATSSTFVSPTTIGTVTSTTASTITINVPTSVAPTGNNYRIRVVASNPSTTSGNDIAVTVISTNLTVSSATTAPFEAVENIDNTGVMNPTGNVSYKSGKSITLSSGTSPTKNFTFNSTGGNVFEAKIQACPY